jgi:hypothetical protein
MIGLNMEEQWNDTDIEREILKNSEINLFQCLFVYNI